MDRLEGNGPVMCAGCKRRTSVTAGTIFDRTRTPLTVWFTACWLFATQMDGISAQSLDPTGKGRKQWTNRWKAALNGFDITFGGRLSAGRK
jgi:hypothetical protein